MEEKHYMYLPNLMISRSDHSIPTFPGSWLRGERNKKVQIPSYVDRPAGVLEYILTPKARLLPHVVTQKYVKKEKHRNHLYFIWAGMVS
jgi:hypothetical protein